MNRYDEIIALRLELKRPGVFRHHNIQLRMLMWHLTIRGSVFFKRLMDIILSILSIFPTLPNILLSRIIRHFGAVPFGGVLSRSCPKEFRLC